MNYYFYLIHFFQPNTVALQLPIYIGATDLASAKSVASTLLNAIKNQFELVLDPSDPKLLVPSINQQTFNYFFVNLNKGNQVVINLPINFNGNIFQGTTTGNSLKSVKALVMIPGNHPNIYSL